MVPWAWRSLLVVGLTSRKFVSVGTLPKDGNVWGRFVMEGAARPKFKFFISYRRERTRDKAEAIYQALVARGHDVFFDSAQLPGVHFDERILQALREADAVLVLAGPRCLYRCLVESDWVRREIVEAVRFHRLLIPVNSDGFMFHFDPVAMMVRRTLLTCSPCPPHNLFWKLKLEGNAERIGFPREFEQYARHHAIEYQGGAFFPDMISHIERAAEVGRSEACEAVPEALPDNGRQNGRKPSLAFGWLVSLVVLSGVFGAMLGFVPEYRVDDLSRIDVPGNGPRFLLGANYPWHTYGNDFGRSEWGHLGVSSRDEGELGMRADVESAFRELSQNGFNAVRWFLFCDGRASPEMTGESVVTGLDTEFYADFDAALGIAKEHDILLIPVLFDHLLVADGEMDAGVQLGGRRDLIINPSKRRRLIDACLTPLFARYGKNRAILAWDVFNEPAWAVEGSHEIEHPVARDQMRAFLEEVVECVHQYTNHYATVNCASRDRMVDWAGCGFDFLMFSYYDHMESKTPLDYPASELQLEVPCVLGEFPTNTTRWPVDRVLDSVYQNGYAGALAWSLHADDEYSGIRSQLNASTFAQWSQEHTNDVNITLEDDP